MPERNLKHFVIDELETVTANDLRSAIEHYKRLHNSKTSQKVGINEEIALDFYEYQDQKGNHIWVITSDVIRYYPASVLRQITRQE